MTIELMHYISFIGGHNNRNGFQFHHFEPHRTATQGESMTLEQSRRYNSDDDSMMMMMMTIVMMMLG